jgi:hypothetical protein
MSNAIHGSAQRAGVEVPEVRAAGGAGLTLQTVGRPGEWVHSDVTCGTYLGRDAK